MTSVSHNFRYSADRIDERLPDNREVYMEARGIAPYIFDIRYPFLRSFPPFFLDLNFIFLNFEGNNTPFVRSRMVMKCHSMV